MPAKDAEACIADPAAMQHCATANRRVVADVKWRPWITVQDAAILHVRPVTDHDRSLSPRTIAENQMLASRPKTTFPMTWAAGASQTSSAID